MSAHIYDRLMSDLLRTDAARLMRQELERHDGRPLIKEAPEHTHVRAGNLVWPRSVEDDLPF